MNDSKKQRNKQPNTELVLNGLSKVAIKEIESMHFHSAAWAEKNASYWSSHLVPVNQYIVIYAEITSMVIDR